MAEAIAYIGAEWLAGTAVGASMMLEAEAWATALTYAATAAAGYSVQQRARRKARQAYNDSQSDRLQTVTATAGARELVLGKVRKSGTVIFRDSCGSDNELFVMVIALANHKISGVEKLYLNELEVTLDSAGNVQQEPYNAITKKLFPQGGNPSGSSLVGGSCHATTDDWGLPYVQCQYAVNDFHANIRIVDGSQTTADARLMTLFPGVWTANHKLLGVAYAVIEFRYSESAFPSGLPAFTCVLKGDEVYDPRTGTTAFSENPALLIRHVVTHPKFGKRSSLSAREEARIIAAANACDTVYTPNAPEPVSGGQPSAVVGPMPPTTLYKAGTVVPYGASVTDVLDDLCAAMCGNWGYAGGELFLKAGVYTAPVLPLTASDIATTQRDSSGGSNSMSISVNTHRARADKVNTVTVKIYDSDMQYQETNLAPIKNTSAIAKDGKELPLELNLAAVTRASQARVIAEYTLKDTFDPLTITATFKMSAYPVELFDNISLTLPAYGWSAKVFTALAKTVSATGLVKLTLKETSAEIYNPNAHSNSGGFSSNSNLVEPWNISNPGQLTLSSGTSELLLQGDGSLITRVRVQWNPVTDERIRQGGYVELRWKATQDTGWTTVMVPGVESHAYLLGAKDSSEIVIIARTRTQLAVSDWNVATTHTVLGKTAPPANVNNHTAEVVDQNLALEWTPVLDVDLAGYEVRTSDSGWGSVGETYRGVSTKTGLVPTSMSNVWYIKAFDRSGNYSQTAREVAFTRSGVDAPDTFTTEAVGSKLRLTWSKVLTPFGVKNYEVRELDSGWGEPGEVYRGAENSVELTPSKYWTAKTWYVKAVDSLGVYSSSATVVNYTKALIQVPTTFTTSMVDGNLQLQWSAVETEFGTTSYEIREFDNSADWGKSGEVYRGTANFTVALPYAEGLSKTWYLKVVDSSGAYSSATKSVTFSKTALAVPATFAAVASEEKLKLSWSSVDLQFGTSLYEVRDADSGWGTAGEVYRGTENSVIVLPLSVGASKTWYVKAVDKLGSYSSAAKSVTYTKPPVVAVSLLSVALTGQKLTLSWPSTTPLFGLGGYEVRTTDSGWGSSGQVYRGTELFVDVIPKTVETTWFIRAFDLFGDYSATSASVIYTVPAVAQVTGLSHVFADTSLTAATVTVSWTDAAPTFGLDYYEFTYNGTSLTLKASSVTVPANWIDNRNFSVTTVDKLGFKSAPKVYSVTKLRPNSAQNFRSQVIDNNVLLYWSLPTKTSLPISHSLLKKGDTWATAEILGTKAGEFTTLFELDSGEFKYWIAVVDTDGYESTPVALTASVSQPPDFLFLGEQTSTYTGTKNNALISGSNLVMPVNLTESFEGHFTSRGWTTPSSQVSAGYPIYIQPGLTSSYYEEIFDFGTVVGSSSVTVTLATTTVSGNPTKFLTISLSDDQVDWTTYAGYSQVFGVNFRYVKIRIDVSQTVSGDLLNVNQLTVRLDTKTFTDSGTVQALETDANGTIVNFNFEVLDVLSLNTTVNSTVSRIAVYDFLDSTKTGTYSVSSNIGTAVVTAHGLRVGQNVRIAPTSGTLARGVYTIRSVPNANSYTFSAVTPNTSGGCVTYPNSFTVYVFDTAGVRKTNTVSWNLRGS